MRLEQKWTPDYPYCKMCGKESKSDTCSENCSNKLTSVRNAIENRKLTDKKGLKEWTPRMIRDFNNIQDIIG